jgi:hypothetical protein
VECATKTKRRVKTLRYSPCDDDTPTAATVTIAAVKSDGVSLLIFKVAVLYLVVHGSESNATPPVVTATVADVGVSSHGL